MKRKEAAFKNMLKQATPPLEPETAWESVSSFNPRQQFSDNNMSFQAQSGLLVLTSLW